MYQTSRNVLFVYGLLLIDLLINITENLIPDQARQNYHLLSAVGSGSSLLDDGHTTPFGPSGNSTTIPDDSTQAATPTGTASPPPLTSTLTFSIFLLQVLAIVCVVANLVVHFFDLSDQVCQAACLRQESDRNARRPRLVLEPLPQRLALKLVLDKYWWSLVVGLSYLVLTIALHIIKIDPSWSSWSSLGSAHDLPSGAAAAAARETSTHLTGLLPVLTVLAHKLTSTCYYLSFVVVYRLTPGQMVSRVLLQQQQQQQSSSNGQKSAN